MLQLSVFLPCCSLYGLGDRILETALFINGFLIDILIVVARKIIVLLWFHFFLLACVVKLTCHLILEPGAEN